MVIASQGVGGGVILQAPKESTTSGKAIEQIFLIIGFIVVWFFIQNLQPNKALELKRVIKLVENSIFLIIVV